MRGLNKFIHSEHPSYMNKLICFVKRVYKQNNKSNPIVLQWSRQNLTVAWPLKNLFFQNWSQCSQTLPLLYQLSLGNSQILSCHFNNFHSIFTRSRLHLHKPLSLLIQKISSSVKVLLRLQQLNHTFRLHF